MSVAVKSPSVCFEMPEESIMAVYVYRCAELFRNLTYRNVLGILVGILKLSGSNYALNSAG